MSQIPELQAQLEELYRRVWPAKPTPQPKSPPAVLVQEEDEQVLARIRAAHDALYSGDMKGYAGESEARGALLFHLIFHTQGNPTQIERLMRASGRDSSKFDTRRGSETFLEYEIRRALEDYTGDYYTPPRTPSLPPEVNYITQEPSTDERIRALEEIVARQGAEIAELRRKDLLKDEIIETQRAALQHMDMQLQAYRSDLGPDADVLIEVAREVAWRVEKGRAEPDGSVYLPHDAVAVRLVGKDAPEEVKAAAKARVKRSIAKAEARKVLDKRTETKLVSYDPDSGELLEAPYYTRRTYVRWGNDYTTMLQSLTTVTRPADAPKRGGWRPRCSEHPTAKVITTHRCSVCNKELKPPADMPEDPGDELEIEEIPDSTNLSHIPSTTTVDANTDSTNLSYRDEATPPHCYSQFGECTQGGYCTKQGKCRWSPTAPIPASIHNHPEAEPDA